MTKPRLLTLVLLFIASTFAFCWGFVIEHSAQGVVVDFKVVYLGARCLIHGCDPYNENQLMRVYRAEGGGTPSTPGEANRLRQIVALQVYFPTAFLYVAPFALLPWATAHAMWSVLTLVSLTLAAFLMWILAQDHVPGAPFYLITFVLVNSGVVFAGGNPAGIAVALCLVGAWCFLQDKFISVGIICLAASLALKPHDSSFVWLYFLLAGGAYRKRAIKTALVVVLLALPVFLWIFHVSPYWLQELRSNLYLTSAPGGITDPRPNSMSGPGGGMMINLQTLISVFTGNASVYNAIAYSIFGLLLLAWAIVTLRFRATVARSYLALASIAALSMLPVYHRPHDAKLLLLAVPACAVLLAEGGPIGWTALILTSGAIFLTSDLPLGAIAILTRDLNFSTGSLREILTSVFMGRPVPLVLLAVGTFYLWVYARRCFRETMDEAGQSERSRDDAGRSLQHL
jgi:hypothetical protein